jgi:hypothetical protein
MHEAISLGFSLHSIGALQMGNLLPDTALANYAYILIMYHVVLAIRIAMSDKKGGLSLPLWQAIVTHAACIAVVVGMAMARHAIPFFGLLRFFLPGIAPFEAAWLFSGEKAKSLVEKQDSFGIVPAEPAATVAVGGVAASAVAPSSFMTSTGDDYEDFIHHMRAGKRPFRKPGVTVKQEFELWLAHRNKTQAAMMAAATQASTKS